jgi:type IV pilus assembly protein PilW
MSRLRSGMPRQSQGFSLVELMVALVVGLLLLAGVLQILLGNRESFNAQRAIADVQEQGRLATFFIENVVAHAGHRVNLIADDDFLFPARNTDDGFSLASESVVAGTNDPDGNDGLHIRFESDGNFTGCDGAPVGTPTNPALGEFSFTVSANGALECNGTDLTDLDSVARLSIRYGLDTAGEDGVVDAYTDSIANADLQRDVKSLRIQLLLRSQDNVLPVGSARTFEFADGNNFTTSADDRRAYQLIDQTVALRNLLP